MKYTVTGNQMKQIDKDTIERIGIPSVVLMERAALAAADQVEILAESRQQRKEGQISFRQGREDGKPVGTGIRVGAVCGTGNNGADGIAAGRILWGRGYQVTLFLAGDPEHGTEEYRLQRQIADRLGMTAKPASAFDIKECDVVLDALFGIGLTRRVEGEYQKLVEAMSKGQGADVVAVDIPSGIHAGTGAVMGAAVKASVTVTFGYLKTGLLLYPGKEYSGRVVVKDIGFSDCSLKQSGWDGMTLEPEDLAGLPGRPADSNKGTFGRLLLVAGAKGMSGAAYLSALAAYRTGAGLVKILTVPENRAILQAQIPEAVVEVLEPADDPGKQEKREDGEGRADEAWEWNDRKGKGELDQKVWRKEFQKKIKKHCEWATAIVAGPGLGQEDSVEVLVEAVLSLARVPVVLDADGLNAVSRKVRLKEYFSDKVIVTPHMGEMARLTGKTISELKADRVRAAQEYAADTGAVCVLKDASTVIADREDRVYINQSGCSAMAKAGSGDVLAGIIGGLLARGMTRTDAAAYGTYLHGLSGERAAAKRGEHALLAREMTEELDW